MNIILDLDDVLANLRESLYCTLSSVTGIDLHWRQWLHYDLRLHYAIDDARLNRVLIENQTLEACEPEPGAGSMTRKLSQLGYRITIVTARGWHPRAQALTAEWLHRHAIHYDRLAVVPLQSNKLKVIDRLDDIALTVDDHPKHIQHYQDAGLKTLVMDRPWNATCQAERVFSMAAVVDWLQADASPRP